MPIHPTAVIDRQAEIDPTAEIGAYVVVEGPVRIGARTTVRPHAYLCGWTTVGCDCDIHAFAAVGDLPQDFHYNGERSYCRIGDKVNIREGVSIHRGSQPESATIIGDECFLMAYSHVGHNCELGRGVKITNLSALGGHVQIGDLAIVSGSCVAHQFVRIGKLAFVAGGCRVTMDAPPFFTIYGDSTVVTHNVVGMRRAGYDAESLREIRSSLRLLYRSGQGFRQALAELIPRVQTPAGRELVAFLQEPSRRGICSGGQPHRQRVRHDGRDEETAESGR